jgi:hypothetical protein
MERGTIVLTKFPFKSIFTGELGTISPGILFQLESKLKIALELKKTNFRLIAEKIKRIIKPG